MNSRTKIILVSILVLVAGAVIWWQFNKKGIVRNQIEKAVASGTDSTYYIHYDSSRIDEVNGNAVFYNIVLQSDSLQQQLYSDDTSDIAKSIFNVRIEKLAILGADIPSFLQKSKVEANVIEITRPVITIIKTGKDEPVKFTASDTLALYEKITGKFKSIQAGEIKIIDGTIAFAKGKKSPHTTLMGVDIDFKNLKIDSTRNYDNIISYFVKDINAKVKNINVKSEKENRLLTFENVEYNAPLRFLKVAKFLQTNLSNNSNLIILNKTKVSGLSTNAFIINRQLKADSLVSDGGAIAVFQSKKQGENKESFEIANEFFNTAIVKNIKLGNTTLTLLNKENKNAPPQVLKNVRFSAYGIDSIATGTDVMKLISNSRWNFAAEGYSFLSKDKLQKIDIGPFVIDKSSSTAQTDFVAVTPTQTREQFVSSLKVQKDLFTLRFNKIKLAGADIEKLLSDKMIIADELTFQPMMTVFNDRTVPPDTESKVGKYPHQSLRNLSIKIFIKNVNIANGEIHYVERGAISKQLGDVSFYKINGTVKNVTNIADYVQRNNIMKVKVSTSFLNAATVTSEWDLPLNPQKGEFKIKGEVGAFDALKLNPVTESLGMGSISSGYIDGYSFNLSGDDLNGAGTGILLYNNLKFNLLKPDTKNGGLEKKGVTSFVANLVIKDKNPQNGKVRNADLAFKRVQTKSFFNLVWKSIFAGAKSSLR